MTDQQVRTAFFEQLGRNLRDKRRERKMSMEDVAAGLRSYRNQVWRWEMGTAEISAWELMRVADVLCCNFVMLLPSRGFTWGEALIGKDAIPDASPELKKTVQRERDPGLSEKERKWA